MSQVCVATQQQIFPAISMAVFPLHRNLYCLGHVSLFSNSVKFLTQGRDMSYHPLAWAAARNATAVCWREILSELLVLSALSDSSCIKHG